ncbi:uncharacterized protein LOC143247466 [Tachypleus tridentatus]|uniref:uncharacterized protein LOC143247466 n=1 Tax=Tachypleus tridentatus TaxID=6853 RepID=UPI003FD24AB4
MLKIYCALIRSKLDYGSLVYGSARNLTLKMLDLVHHQLLQFCMETYHSVQSLYTESLSFANVFTVCFKISIITRASHLGLYFLSSLGLAFSDRRSAIVPFCLRIQVQLDQLGLSLDNIAVFTSQPIPSWLITVPKGDFTLSHPKKAGTPEWGSTVSYLPNIFRTILPFQFIRMVHNLVTVWPLP